MHFVNPVAAALCAAMVVAASAQQYETLDNPVGEFRPYDRDSGLLDNEAGAASTLFHEEVRIEDAAWIRLYFAEAALGPGSFVRIRSLLDGEVQELDANAMTMWGNTSAYFNGDTVTVELVGGAKTQDNRLVIDHVAVEMPGGIAAGGSGQCGICGADDRVPSVEKWTARLLPAGCTASVYSQDSCMVSAGHCIGGAMVVQFKVPASNANCSLNNPPVSEQFPATATAFVSGGVGNDWSVLEPGTNNLGEKPYDRYGDLRPIVAAPVGVGTAVVLTGYGVDLTCTRSQTQQTADGTICTVAANLYTFNVDLRGGNSGSSLTANGEIIGIVTHCPCCNIATRVDLAAFVAARNLCPPVAPTPIATGPSSLEDGWLEVSPDPYGSWYVPFSGASGDNEDRFNPAGALSSAPAAFTSGFFFFSGGQRQLLSRSGDWQGVVGGSQAVSVTVENSASDTDADGIDDTVTSSFQIIDGGTDLTFDLTQHVEKVDTTVSLLTQEYVITNNSASPIDFTLVRAFDGDLVWTGDFTNDTVGTNTNDTPGERHVFEGEPGLPEASIALSSPQGGPYYGGKNGVDPDGGGGSVPYGFGTNADVWDAFGVPAGWVNNIAGVGYDTDGESGSTPPGSVNPQDGFIGLSIDVSLGAGLGPTASTTVIVHHTYGSISPVLPDPCPWDCGDFNDDVGINDFLQVLAEWDMVGTPCDFDGGGVGINDFLDLLANWGPCP